jgi:hypothetical protein
MSNITDPEQSREETLDYLEKIHQTILTSPDPEVIALNLGTLRATRGLYASELHAHPPDSTRARDLKILLSKIEIVIADGELRLP